MDSGLVYLTQTDTTVGFLSSNDKKLAKIKQRELTKKTLQVVESFQRLKHHTRVPKRFRKMVRNSKLTTFIYPNQNGFRVIDHASIHHHFIKKFGTLYSTSANLTQNSFDQQFAISSADIIVYNSPFEETTSSAIYKLSKTKKKKIR